MMKKSFLKKMGALIMAGVLALAIAPVSVRAEEGAVLTGKTAMEITSMMGKGFNIGNTLDATGGSMDDIVGHETGWGNPQINAELMHGIKAAGFDTVRIPTTWMKHIDKSNNYKISDDFMNRVKEVVDLAYDEGLFVILNVHHESWVNRSDLGTAYEEVGKELSSVWSQISEAFADYDQHLIFEGMNEPRSAGTSDEWTGTKSTYDAVIYLDGLFVEAVRENGKGYNNERMLMIPGYAASSDPKILRTIVVPEINGAPAENIAVSVHCYSPYNFCLSDNQVTFDPKRSADTADITTLLKNLKTLFLDKDIPVVIGECGCTNSGDNNDARLAWFNYFGGITAEYGIPAVVWDNGVAGKSGGECHKYLERKTGEAYSPDLIAAFTCNFIGELGDTVINFESIKSESGTTLIVPSDVGFTSNTLNCQMKVNHTEGAALGFALKVEPSEDNFTAMLNISKYSGRPVKVTAWISSKAEDNVKVGIMADKETEMVSVDTSEDWTKVSFVCTPADGRTFVYFKGTNDTFYVDDITISMDTTPDADEEVITEAPAEEEKAPEQDTAENIPVVPEAETGMSPITIVLIATAAVALIAAAVIVIGSRKKK